MKEKEMPEAAQEALADILNNAPGWSWKDLQDKIWCWHQRHQPPRMTREHVEKILKDHTPYGGRLAFDEDPDSLTVIVDALCALALPPRPTVTKAQIDRILNQRLAEQHEAAIGSASALVYEQLVDDLYRLCTGTGEESITQEQAVLPVPAYPQTDLLKPDYQLCRCCGKCGTCCPCSRK